MCEKFSTFFSKSVDTNSRREYNLDSELNSTKGGDTITDTIRLKDAINKKGLKLEFIAQQIGITREALSAKINNKSEFKASEITILSDVLSLTSEQIKLFFLANE
ncbi:helix-turn-helix domain-containing protein [Bacteroides heparinolyticus]|uniref:helix-turn-helix domain-containing protein n=2 Tax=Prevotella heparinolytica TaxID=28113 RepID=UPI0035A16D1C